MKRFLAILTVLAVVLVAFAACGGGNALTMTMGTGGTQGTYYAYGGILGNHLKTTTGITVNVVSTDGSKANILGIDTGNYQLGTVQSDVMAYAAEGSRTFEAEGAIDSFRVIGGLYAEAVQLITMDPAIKSVADLKGKKVGIQNGTTSDMLIADLIADGTLAGSEIIPYTSPAVAAASMNKQDAVVTDKLTAQLIVANDSSLKALPLVKADGTPAAEVEEYGIAVQKGNKELLDAINKVLEKLIADGTIDKWVEEYSAKAKEVDA